MSKEQVFCQKYVSLAHEILWVLRDKIFKKNFNSYRQCMGGLCWAHLVLLPPRHIENQISRVLHV